MINNMFVIDAHCHIYPEKIAAKATEHTDNFYGVHSANKGTTTDLKETGLKNGIDHFVVHSVATTAKQVRSINQFIAGEVDGSEGRFTGLGTLYPDSPDLEEDYEHLRSLGLKGVKLHPDIQGFKLDDYRCLRIYELCERDGLPVLLHTGDSRYDNSNPNRLLPILKIYTGLTVIGAHFGGWSVYEEASRKMSGIDNLYVDCSSSFYYLSKDKTAEIIARYGEDKVMFGTDYPMWAQGREIETLLSLGLSDTALEKIFSLNAKKVYGIE